MYYTNKDIRIAMIQADVSSRELAEYMGYSEKHMSLLLKTEDLDWFKKTKIKRAINEMKENKHE